MIEILFCIFIPVVVVIYVEMAQGTLYGKNYKLNPPPKPLSEDERAKEIDSFKKISNEIMECNITMLNADKNSNNKEQISRLYRGCMSNKNITIAVDEMKQYITDTDMEVSEYKEYILTALEFYKNNSQENDNSLDTDF